MMVKKVITNLDFPKASGADCILVVVLKNCESEHSYILVELFNEGVLFSKLLEGFIGRPCISECWEKVYS